jgi:hypothetical protein
MMQVVQLEKVKRALRAQQTIAIHDLGDNREIYGRREEPR